MGPTFSVIVPCYNLAPWIRACLDSVLVQSCADWECIVVDDESKDESGAILDEYAARDARIRVVHQKNQGEGGARNSGIAVAQGEWMFFLDGDDVMAPGALNRLNQILENHPDEQLIRFGYERFRDGEDWTPKCLSGNGVRKDISAQIPMVDFYTYVWQHLYRRDVIQGIHFKEYKRGCDRVFVDEVLLNRVASFVETPEVFYGYRVRTGSAMNSIPSAQILMDEMDHRIDIIRLIESSDKEIAYAGDYWLEGYLLFGILFEFRNRPDLSKLRAEWFSRLKELSTLAHYSLSGRFILWCWLHPPFSIIPYLRYVFLRG